MDNLRAVIKNLFCYISPEEIIQGKTKYNDIEESTFSKLGSGYIERYTKNEIRNMYFYLKSEFQWQNNRLKVDVPVINSNNSLNVFDALLTVNFSILVEESGEPLCQYQHLLRWRDLITMLDEDLFTTSFFAMQDILYGLSERKYFFWKPVIGHNNFALNRLVANGVAENHFHLKGSAPTFYLSWISLMNDVQNYEFEKIFNSYDENKLQMNINYSYGLQEKSYIIMWRLAALIRLYLFTKLKGDYILFDATYIPIKMIKKYYNKKNGKNKKFNNTDENYCIDLNSIQEELPIDIVIQLRIAYTEQMVHKMLHDTAILDENLSVIQRNIDRIKNKYGKCIYDYTICESWLYINKNKRTNEILTGERWFLYSVFRKVYEKDKEWKGFINYFYLYLVLKTHIRREIVQANKTYGFENFYLYQERKEDFIENTIYESIYIKMAVRDTILNQHIKKLEARIAPKGDLIKFQQAIQKYDNAICSDFQTSSEKEEFLKKYFYVVHFIKSPETDKDRVFNTYRHFHKRQEVMRQAKVINEMREKKLPEAKRIYGIDSSSSEIGCRPEVFAQVFRYLQQYNNIPVLRNEIQNETFEKNSYIMATYHVGEDFLDIIDGLRAIDETIHFLNFKCGDRLGHALVLGIDVDEWYHIKSDRILISKQDYLDNIVWLYAKIRKYNITDCDEAIIYIEKRYNELFNEIYKNNIDEERISGIYEEARKYFKSIGLGNYYKNTYSNMDINTYYDAWKLRGDNPELYKKGYFDPTEHRLEKWDFYSVNREFPKNYKIRFNAEISLLYYLYHYNATIKAVGREVMEVRIKPCLIKAIKCVRKIMEKEIAQMGIGIETNPSSNYLISTFRRYDKHPIINWYNVGLTNDLQKLQDCPQLQVSINTDDQGVFSTYIENEYAYLAIALEKVKDEHGVCIYSRNAILQWLEQIRNIGIKQSFYQEEN